MKRNAVKWSVNPKHGTEAIFFKIDGPHVSRDGADDPTLIEDMLWRLEVAGRQLVKPEIQNFGARRFFVFCSNA